MSRELTVTLKSDKSDEEIPRGTGGRVRILFNDANRVDMRADLTSEELDTLIADYKLKPVQPRPGQNRKKRMTL